MQDVDVPANIVPANVVVAEAVETVVNVAEKRGRNFSFKHKEPDTLDEVEVDGQVFKIPAAVGSCYWAVLKVCYEKHDKPVYLDDMIQGVAGFMEDRDDQQWAVYVNKEKTTVHKTIEGAKTRTVQKIKTWQERIINNAKTLCRTGGNSAYGLRLTERGHCLKFHHDDDGRPYFILKTSVEAKIGDDNGVSAV